MYWKSIEAYYILSGINGHQERSKETPYSNKAKNTNMALTLTWEWKEQLQGLELGAGGVYKGVLAQTKP